MIGLNKHKVLVLPNTLEPNSLYLVEDGDYINLYIVNKSGSLKKLGNKEMITDLIEESVVRLTTPLLHVYNEIPIGIINGSNVNFTSEFPFIHKTVTIFVNGIKQSIVKDYQLTVNRNIIFTFSLDIIDSIFINYTKL